MGLMTIAVFEAAAQRRGSPIIVHPGNPGIPGLPAQPAYPMHPIQPGWGHGATGGAFRQDRSSNTFVGTVPYLVPVPAFVGGAPDEGPPAGEDPAGWPDSVGLSSAPIAPPQLNPPAVEPRAQACAPVAQEDPVHFFIALKDGTVDVGVAYWVVNGTLHYLTLDGSHNQVSLDLINRAISARLNERGRVPFILP
jgi:hypothetical protein